MSEVQGTGLGVHAFLLLVWRLDSQVPEGTSFLEEVWSLSSRSEERLAILPLVFRSIAS